MTAKSEKSKLMESTGGETMAMGVKYPTPEQGKLIFHSFFNPLWSKQGGGGKIVALLLRKM